MAHPRVFLNKTTKRISFINEGQMQIGSPWNMLGGIPVIIVFRFIFTAVAVGLIGFALYKLILFVRDQQAQFNVPQVCLALEIIANICKAVTLVTYVSFNRTPQIRSKFSQ